MLGWMAPHFPEGTSDADKQAAYDAATKNKDKIVTTPDGGREIRDAFGIPGAIITVKVVDAATGKISVTAGRKVFEITTKKSDVLPGVASLGGHSYEPEQEIHGLTTIRPWDIKSSATGDSIGTEFPEVVAPPTATPDPTAAPDPNATSS